MDGNGTLQAVFRTHDSRFSYSTTTIGGQYQAITGQDKGWLLWNNAGLETDLWIGAHNFLFEKT